MEKEVLAKMIHECLQSAKEANIPESDPGLKMVHFIAEHEGIPLEPEQDYTAWKQAGQMTPAELLERRALTAKGTQAVREAKVLQAQADALGADLTADREKFWAGLYREHSLPRGNYHLTEEGKILLDPTSLERGKNG